MPLRNLFAQSNPNASTWIARRFTVLLSSIVIMLSTVLVTVGGYLISMPLQPEYHLLFGVLLGAACLMVGTIIVCVLLMIAPVPVHIRGAQMLVGSGNPPRAFALTPGSMAAARLDQGAGSIIYAIDGADKTLRLALFNVLLPDRAYTMPISMSFDVSIMEAAGASELAEQLKPALVGLMGAQRIPLRSPAQSANPPHAAQAPARAAAPWFTIPLRFSGPSAKTLIGTFALLFCMLLATAAWIAITRTFDWRVMTMLFVVPTLTFLPMVFWGLWRHQKEAVTPQLCVVGDTIGLVSADNRIWTVRSTIADLVVTIHWYQFVLDDFTFESPAMALGFPGSSPLVIGSKDLGGLDPRWKAHAQQIDKPEHEVGAAEWALLRDKLRSKLER